MVSRSLCKPSGSDVAYVPNRCQRGQADLRQMFQRLGVSLEHAAWRDARPASERPQTFCPSSFAATRVQEAASYRHISSG